MLKFVKITKISLFVLLLLQYYLLSIWFCTNIVLIHNTQNFFKILLHYIFIVYKFFIKMNKYILSFLLNKLRWLKSREWLIKKIRNIYLLILGNSFIFMSIFHKKI